MAGVPAIFDRVARRQHRDRAAQAHFIDLETHVADALIERLAMVSRGFETALVINSGNGVLATALRGRGMIVTETDYGPRFASRTGVVFCDEEYLARFADSFDLVIAPAGFETIDDLPGALIMARRALKPGGLFLGAVFGAPSLSSLRTAMTEAQRDSGRHVVRFHPEIDVRSAGDLLSRVGLTLPVADLESLTLSYASLGRLLDDFRAAGVTNTLANRYPLSRAELDRARIAFAAMAGPDGRTAETVSLIMLTGWAA